MSTIPLIAPLPQGAKQGPAPICLLRIVIIPDVVARPATWNLIRLAKVSGVVNAAPLSKVTVPAKPLESAIWETASNKAPFSLASTAMSVGRL